MLVKFLQDYQGYLTPGHFYTQWSEVDLDDDRAQALIEAGRAVKVQPDLTDEYEAVAEKRKAGRPKKAQ